MNIVNSLLGLIVILVGLFPYFEDSFEGLSSISSGPVYNGIIIVVGMIILVYNLKKKEIRLR